MVLASSACSQSPSGKGSTSSTTGAGGGGGGAECAATTVACADQIIQQMNLKPQPAPGLIQNAPDGAGWTTTVDATAGGAFATDPPSYVYGKFGDAGLDKVAISDVDAIDSMDWDIAFRRYVVRINSGDSGPSCVVAAHLPGTPDYGSVTSVPATADFLSDDYFTDSCELIPDGSGLPSSPATAMSSYWEYPGCVKMTGNVFIVKTRDGRALKLTVTSYYKDVTAQETCDTTGAVPMGTAGATIVMRWAFLP